MKKSLLPFALGMLLACTASVSAQDKKGERKASSPEERMKRMADALQLTDEQKTKLAPIMKEEGEKLRAIYQDQSTPREERAKKMQAARKETDAKVKPILTPEQAAKYEKLQAELQAKRKQQ